MVPTTLADALAAERDRDVQRNAAAARLAAMARCCTTTECCKPLRRAHAAVGSMLTTVRDRALGRRAVAACCTG